VLQEPDPGLPEHTTIPDSSLQVISAVAKTPGAIGYADLNDVSGSVTTLDIKGYAPTIPLIEKGYYPFWAIEHMYTQPNPDALSISFIHYVIQDLPTGDNVIRLTDMDCTALESHQGMCLKSS